MSRVLYGSIDGYFTNCMLEIPLDTPVGSGTYYPIGMTLENAMKYFWVLRSFTFNAEEISLPITFDSENEVPTDKEEVMVCNLEKIIEKEILVSTPGPGGGTRDRLIYYQSFFYPSYRINEENEKIFYFYTFITASDTLDGGTPYQKNSVSIKTTPSDQIAFTLDFFNFGQIDFYTPASADGFVQCSFSNPLYHSYSGIWDTQTGDRLD